MVEVNQDTLKKVIRDFSRCLSGQPHQETQITFSQFWTLLFASYSILRVGEEASRGRDAMN